jgi:hypothetical protein
MATERQSQRSMGGDGTRYSGILPQSPKVMFDGIYYWKKETVFVWLPACMYTSRTFWDTGKHS